MQNIIKGDVHVWCCEVDVIFQLKMVAC